ncbi:MAG: sulfotransferase [Alphaproteobacteria bacterium]
MGIAAAMDGKRVASVSAMRTGAEALEQFLFIIGAPKCGTTTLANWLGQRSDMVLCAQKEPRYFTDFPSIDWQGPGADWFVSSMISREDDYWRAFANDKSATWAIDASTDYLWCEHAAHSIKDFSNNRDVKVICILRDPVDRALSEYQHTRRDRYQSESFQNSLRLEPERRAKHWKPLFYHARRSSYYADLCRYADLFGDRFMIMDFDVLKDPDACLTQVADFLGVPFEPTWSSTRHNESYVEVNPLASRVLHSTKVNWAARRVLGRGPSDAFMSSLDAMNKKRLTFSERDRLSMLEKVAGDVEACRDDSRIPTATWSSLELL